MPYFLLSLLLLLVSDGQKYLSEVSLYQKASSFESTINDQQTLKEFVKSAPANLVLDPVNYDLHLLNAALHFATNENRLKHGRSELKFVPALRDAAVLHTNEMITRNFFDHYNKKNRKYYSPEQRLNAFDIKNVASAENCDYTYIDLNESTTYLQLAREIVKDFYESSGHKKNMLNKTYTHLGCGVMFEPKSKKGVWYVKATQVFAKL